MSPAQTVAKLQALLARIRARAVEPRSALTATASVTSFGADGASSAARPSTDTDRPTLAPAMPQAAAEADVEVEVDYVEAAHTPVPPRVSVPTERVAAGSAESVERLVAAQPAAPAQVAPARAKPTPMESAVAEASLVAERQGAAGSEEAVAEVEPAPASSRRPVQPEPAERLEQMAFGDAEESRPPIHTPPPESGRMPAAPAVEFEADTGVHDAMTAEAEAEVPSGTAPVALQADGTRPDLRASDTTAHVIGEAQSFSPGTFLDLLEATLSL
jgi:hypothetical protein